MNLSQQYYDLLEENQLPTLKLLNEHLSIDSPVCDNFFDDIWYNFNSNSSNDRLQLESYSTKSKFHDGPKESISVIIQVGEIKEDSFLKRQKSAVMHSR